MALLIPSAGTRVQSDDAAGRPYRVMATPRPTQTPPTQTDMPHDGAEPKDGSAPRMRGYRIGFVAGIAAISCCVYPVVLVLFGAASASEAIGLGNHLYRAWGWAFKVAGVLLAVAGIILQLRRRGQCSVAGVRSAWPFLLRVALVMSGVYATFYCATKGLASLKRG